MIEAIIAGIVAAAVAVAIIVVIYRMVRNRGPKVGAKTVKQVHNYGVGTSPLESAAPKSGDVHVNESHGSVKRPSDSLQGRFVALGVLGAAVFGSLAAKLWSLQLLSGSAYSAEAEENLYTTVSTPAPRGIIYDRNGVTLVGNRPSQTVLADAAVADSRDSVRRLSTVLGIPAQVVRSRILDAAGGAQNQRVVASDVRLRDVAYIAEHAQAFPGVTVEERMVRDYPYGALAAHVLGYTGAPSDAQLELEIAGREIEAVDTVGLAGIEAYYDNLISGDNGERRVKVDSHGNVIDVVSETKPSKGSDIYLTIDAQLQYVTDSVLASTIAPKGIIGEGSGAAGAALVMDVRDGSILALSSYPTFDPSLFTGGIPSDIWDLYNTEESYAPLNNRVVNGQYAVASTFKPFTALASLECGIANDKDKWVCGGAWDGFGSGQIQRCWLHSGHGELDLRGGIVNSCDIVFYELGKAFYDRGPEGTKELSDTALQDYLARFNFDQPTGIDLSNESVGRIPTPAWKAEYFRNRPADAGWRGGDYANMMIGQGDVLATPIELAAAYCGLATGTILKPHLLKEVKNSSGDTVMSVEREVVKELDDINPEDLAFVRDAMRGVIADNPDDAKHFRGFSVPLAGKSGTAEHGDRNSDAWFVCYGPYDDPRYLVVIVIEQGGFGGTVAAPLAAKIMAAALERDNGDELELETVAGSSGHSTKTIGGASGRGD